MNCILCPSLNEVVLGNSSITGGLATGFDSAGGGSCLVLSSNRKGIIKGGFYEWDWIPMKS